LAARQDARLVPLSRAASVRENLDLIAGGISFTRERSAKLIDLFLQRASHCGSDCGCHDVRGIATPNAAADTANPPATPPTDAMLDRFFARVLQGEASAKDLMRVTITSFLDAYNFDVRQLMKCCTHHVLPSGHIVPFCAYNTLYRPGHLKLPELKSNPAK